MTARSSVIVFSETLWPNGGGAELATHFFTKCLVNHGFNVTVVTGQSSYQSQAGVAVLPTSALKAASKTELWLKILSREALFENIMRDYEIVYIPRLCYPLAPIAKKLGKKLVVHLHDYAPISYTAAVPAPYEHTDDYFGKVKAFNLWLERRKGRSAQSLAIFGNLHTRLARYWLGYADQLICVSDRQMQIISASAPELGSLLSRVYNPLPEMPKSRGSSRDKSRFLYLGGDAYHKGFHVFIKAANQLLSQGANVKFLMTGNADHLSDSLSRCSRFRFDGAFEFLGRLPYNQLLEKYSTVRGLIFPSIWEEPLSYAVAESMAAGTIPVASNVGGNSELIRGSAAEPYLFDSFRSDSLARNIETILSLSDSELLSIGENLRRSISHTLRAQETTERFVRFFEH